MAKASTISFKKAWNAVEDIGFGIENISNLCKGGASDWQIFTGIVDSAIQIFEGFAEVVNIIKTLAAVSKAATTEQTTAAAADTVSTKVEAMAYRNSLRLSSWPRMPAFHSSEQVLLKDS